MSNSARDINKCIIIAGVCLKWQGKDCLQTTASKKHSPLSNEDILKAERMSDTPFSAAVSAVAALGFSSQQNCWLPKFCLSGDVSGKSAKASL